MAAPENEFIQKRLETLVGSTTKDARIGIYDANVATLKTRYYLDFIRGVSEYDANGVEVVDKSGFIGGCVIGSDNYYMHNTARHWSVGSLTASNEVLFNDAGKNTLGRVSNPLGDGKVQVVNDEIGTIELTARFRSAWHVSTNKQGFEWLTPGFANTTNNFGAQDKQVVEYRTRVLNTNDQHNQIAGNTFQVRAYVENAEGKWTGEWINFLIKPRQITMKFNAQYASSAYNGIVNRTVYVGTPELKVGTLLYTTQAMGEADGVVQGYYTFGEEWFQVSYVNVGGITRSQIVAMGAATASGWPAGDPAYDSGARVRQDAYYDASGFANPCDRWAQNLLPNRTIWRSTFNNVYYTAEVGGSIIDNGWYVWGGIWHSMAGGMINGTGSCPTGT